MTPRAPTTPRQTPGPRVHRRATARIGAGLLLALAGACGDSPAKKSTDAPPERPRGIPRRERLELSAGELRASIAAMEALDLHDLVVDAAARLLAEDDGSSWRRSGGWAFRTFELAYWTSWGVPLPGGDGSVMFALDFEREDHPYHAIVRYAQALEARGVDFLVVPVPLRTQVYPERLAGIERPADGFGGIDLAHARYLLALVEAGVEVLDLLPAFAAQRSADPRTTDALLYHAHDRHWTPRGARLAAELLAERVRQLPWYAPGPLREGVDFVVRHEKATWQPRPKPGLPESELPVEVWFDRVVRPGGNEPLEASDRASPIVLLGDSFLTHFQDEHAGIANQLCAELRMPLDTIALPGGGSVAVWQALARRERPLEGKHLVIWLSSTDQLADPRLHYVDLFAD